MVSCAVLRQFYLENFDFQKRNDEAIFVMRLTFLDLQFGIFRFRAAGK